MRARLLLLAGALAAFGASLGSGFHFDDYAIFSGPIPRSGTGLAPSRRALKLDPNLTEARENLAKLNPPINL